ncbi:MAG: hypothetical protein NXI27_31380 [Alphaproteobacteria bacterium]|nr:hypothetical protein [Alphaproteobacteria bacterium]
MDVKDWALIISTSATAITAVGGVIFPLAMRLLDKNRERNLAVRNEILNALFDGLNTLDSEQIRLQNNVLNLHYKSPAGDEAFKSVGFMEAIEKLEVYASAHGLDVAKISFMASEFRVLAYKFAQAHVEADSKRASDISQEVAKLRSDFKTSLTDLIKDLNEKYPA